MSDLGQIGDRTALLRRDFKITGFAWQATRARVVIVLHKQASFVLPPQASVRKLHNSYQPLRRNGMLIRIVYSLTSTLLLRSRYLFTRRQAMPTEDLKSWTQMRLAALYTAPDEDSYDKAYELSFAPSGRFKATVNGQVEERETHKEAIRRLRAPMARPADVTFEGVMADVAEEDGQVRQVLHLRCTLLSVILSSV